MARLDITTEKLDSLPEAKLVQLVGAIDASTALEFGNALDNLQKEGVSRVFLDLEKVEFVNSTGLGLLVRAADRLSGDGQILSLVRVHPKVRIVFSTLGLDSFLTIFKTLDSAIEDAKERLGVASGAPGRPPGPPQRGTQRRPHAAPPAPPAPRRGAMAAPPPPAAPRPGAAGGTQVRGGRPPACFIILPPQLSYFGVLYSVVQSACTGARMVTRRMDATPTQTAHQHNVAAIQHANFVLVDLTPDPKTNKPNNQVYQYARYALQLRRHLICLIAGSKDRMPQGFERVNTVVYAPSQEGMNRLKQQLEGGLRTLVSRLSGRTPRPGAPQGGGESRQTATHLARPNAPQQRGDGPVRGR
jgi:anti-sigma B factor antagonist